MKRLTNYWGNLKRCAECAENSNCYSDHSCGHIAESIAKLRDYEGLEEQGKLLKLPCAVGDTVYVKMPFGGYAEAEVRDYSFFLSCGFCIVVTSDKFDKQNIPFTEFGKTVFFTEEEARAALNGTMEGDG